MQGWGRGDNGGTLATGYCYDKRREDGKAARRGRETAAENGGSPGDGSRAEPTKKREGKKARGSIAAQGEGGGGREAADEGPARPLVPPCLTTAAPRAARA